MSTMIILNIDTLQTFVQIIVTLYITANHQKIKCSTLQKNNETLAQTKMFYSAKKNNETLAQTVINESATVNFHNHQKILAAPFVFYV